MPTVKVEWNWTYDEAMKLQEFGNKFHLAQEVMLIFIAILTILGNSLVLLATWRERSLHQPNKYFIACLAMADLLVGIVLAPLRVYVLDDLRRESSLYMSIHLCRFLKWIDIFALAASIYTLTFISFDRYLKISKPLQYKSRMTTSRSLKIIFIIWLISTAFASYAATNYSGNYGILINVNFYCPFDSSHARGFHIFLAIAGVLLPTVIILVLYTLIFVVAHKRQKMLRNGQLGERPNNQNQRSVFFQDLKVIRMLLVVVGVLMVCWLPLLIHYRMIPPRQFKYPIAFSFSDLRQELIIQLVVYIFPYFNSLCNPVIYALLDQKYREGFKRVFQGIVRRGRNSGRQRPVTIDLPPLRTRQT